MARWAPELLPILADAELREQVMEDLRSMPAAQAARPRARCPPARRPGRPRHQGRHRPGRRRGGDGAGCGTAAARVRIAGLLRGTRAATDVSSADRNKSVTSGVDTPTVAGTVGGVPADKHGRPARPGAAGLLSTLPPVATGSPGGSARPSVYYTTPPSTAPTSSPTQPTSTPSSSPSSSPSRPASPSPSASTSKPSPSPSASTSTPTPAPTSSTSTPTPTPSPSTSTPTPTTSAPNRPRRRRARLPRSRRPPLRRRPRHPGFGIPRGVAVDGSAVDGSPVGVSHDLVPTSLNSGSRRGWRMAKPSSWRPRRRRRRANWGAITELILARLTPPTRPVTLQMAGVACRPSPLSGVLLAAGCALLLGAFAACLGPQHDGYHYDPEAGGQERDEREDQRRREYAD